MSLRRFRTFTTATAVTFAMSGTRRHHVASAAPPGGGSPFLYETGGQSGDGNGGLTYRPATVAGDTAKVVAYDLEGRAVAMNVGGQTIESVYDDGGRRIARIVNGTEESFFFGRYFEVREGQLVRHIYAGDRRIAFSPIAAPPSLSLAALADDHPAVLLARAGREAAWLHDLPPLTDPGRPVQAAGAVVLGMGLLLLAVLPAGRGRPGPFGRLRRGRVILVVVLYVTALPDWTPPAPIPEPAGVAWADCPGPAPSYPAYLVHTDHLGSTTLLTAYKLSGQTDGAVMQYIRYGPYGAPQAYQPDGTPVASGAELTEHTYTGQRWDAAAQLYDYGARFYDPRLARFLTTDPAREYVNPYAYVRWNPVRFLDPTGMLTVPGGGAAFALALQSGSFAPGHDALASPALARGLGGVMDDGSTAAGANAYTYAAQAFASAMAAMVEAARAAAVAAVANAAHVEGSGAGMTVAAPTFLMSQGADIMPSLPVMFPTGYVDVNVSINPSVPGWGVTFGVQFEGDGFATPAAFYVGPSYGVGSTIMVTFAPMQAINEGVVAGVTWTGPGVAGQTGWGWGTNTGGFVEGGAVLYSTGGAVSGSFTFVVGSQILGAVLGR